MNPFRTTLHTHVLVAALAVSLSAVVAAFAQAPPTQTRQGTPAGRPASPMMLEIHRAMDLERATLAELGARRRAASDDAAALAIEKQVERAKRSTEAEILRIQARYARAAGRLANAARLEAAVLRLGEPLVSPRAVAAPPSPR